MQTIKYINYINILHNIDLIEDVLNQLIQIMCDNSNKSNLDINIIINKLMSKVDKSNINLITDIVEQMINEYIKSGLINKACHYKKLSNNGSQTNNSYINLRDLLISNSTNNNSNDDFFICSFNNNKLKCLHTNIQHQKSKCLNCNNNNNQNKNYLNCNNNNNKNKNYLNCNNQNKNCLNCNKWHNDRSQFKDQIIEIINEKHTIDIIRLIPKTISLLPTVILDKDPYNDFLRSLEAYKKSKKIIMNV